MTQQQNAKKLLIEIHTKIKDQLGYEDAPDTSNSYTIKTEDFSYDITKKVIMVGRESVCDVLLGHHSCSRLHCVVFVQKNNIIVLDIGSMCGTYTKHRSSEKELEHSTLDVRKPLVFDRSERFILHMGDKDGELVSFHPKLCIVCCDKPRERVADCGHYILCDTCYKIWRDMRDECPNCRGRMGSGKRECRLTSYSLKL